VTLLKPGFQVAFIFFPKAICPDSEYSVGANTIYKLLYQQLRSPGLPGTTATTLINFHHITSQVHPA
jgi:hypothetical protein